MRNEKSKKTATAWLLATALVVGLPQLASAETVLRIGMTAADIPRTLGQPDQGFEGNRFTGLTMYDALTTAPDSRVAGFTALLSLVTAILFGIAPAAQGPTLDLNRTLREEAGFYWRRRAPRAHPQGARRRAGGAVDAARRRSRTLRAQSLQSQTPQSRLRHERFDLVHGRSGARRIRPGAHQASSTTRCSHASANSPECSRHRSRKSPVLTGNGAQSDHPRARLRTEARREQNPKHQPGWARLLPHGGPAARRRTRVHRSRRSRRTAGGSRQRDLREEFLRSRQPDRPAVLLPPELGSAGRSRSSAW